MNIIWTVLVCLLCVGPTYAQASRTDQGSKEGKTNLALIEQAILQGRINRVDVFYLPLTIETASALNPGDVEHFFRYKLEIGLLASHSKLMTSFCQAVEGTKLGVPVSYHGDFRWGCKFYNDKQKKVYSVFLDSTGKVAVVDGKRMNVDGGIYPWLTTSFLPRFTPF